MKRDSPGTWSHSVGSYGCRVRVYEAEPGGRLYLMQRVKGRGVERRSLGHRNQEQAKREAQRAHAAALYEQTHGVPPVAPVDAPLVASAVTLDAVCEAYHIGRSANKTPQYVERDRRVAEFWKRALRAKAGDVRAIVPADVERIAEQRRRGEINAKGEPVATQERRPVRARAVAGDIEALRAILRYAVRKARLLRENPIDGVDLPHEKNPRRPVATEDRYALTRAAAENLKRRGQRITTYLPELLDLAKDTGHRIGAICALRYEDVQLERSAGAPWGAIRWPEATDKMGQESTIPMGPLARAAVERVLAARPRGKGPEGGRAYLFPSPKRDGRPVSKDLASAWLQAAEVAAELPKLDGSLWHAYRRAWATARKGQPVQDVAAAGGWRNLSTLQNIYQQPDAATMLRVIAPAEMLTDILTDLSIHTRKSRKPARAEATHGLALAN